MKITQEDDEKKEKTKYVFERFNVVFGHPLRPQVVHQLKKGPSTARGIASEIGVPQQNINYHIRELKNADIVQPAFKPSWSQRNTGYQLTDKGQAIGTILNTNFTFKTNKTQKKKKAEESE